MSSMEAGKIYRIAKWKETFEVSESRRHKVLYWVSVPNNMSSNGYVEMINHFGQDAPAMYGAWIALVMIASHGTVRGLLCSSRGIGYTVARLSQLSHFPNSVFEKLIPWASSPEVGWLEELTAATAKSLLNDSNGPESSEKTQENGNGNGDTARQPAVTQPLPGLQDKTDLTRQNLTTTDQTRASSRSSSVVVKDSLSVEGLKLDWTWKQVAAEGERFRTVTKLRVQTLSTEDLKTIIGFGLSTDNGFLGDIAAKIRTGDVRQPRKWIHGAIRTYCQEHGINHVVALEAVDKRILEVEGCQETFLSR